MKRPTHDGQLWEDPTKSCTLEDLQKVLNTFGVEFDKSEIQPQIFQRYVQLALMESPESVRTRIGHDPSGELLPARELTCKKMKIFLAIHKIGFQSHHLRSSWIQAYNSIRRLQRNQTSVNTSKKIKPNSSNEVVNSSQEVVPPKPPTRKPLSACD
ncbi:hypothetical protein VP01_1660g9 [Puccinia sorghi]|uniref:Uncharacterized protein n=1 Tax=Puccinia sorghi TaxID=27349 RepID=A0A0L6VGV6_9BASI|nr:hypothetical protein VP01_1660g9 [Puccinia sorghi]